MTSLKGTSLIWNVNLYVLIKAMMVPLLLHHTQNLWFSLPDRTKNAGLEVNLEIISTPWLTDVETEVQAEVIPELN